MKSLALTILLVGSWSLCVVLIVLGEPHHAAAYAALGSIAADRFSRGEDLR
jgi:hypothetical protein